MGFLDGVKNFVQKNILDKTTIDEQLGNAFNTAKSNLSAWSNPQVRQDFSRETIQQPVANFTQKKIVDPATKLKNRVSSMLTNYQTGLNQRVQAQGGWGGVARNMSPIGFFDETTRNVQKASPVFQKIVENRDNVNRYIDSKPNARFIGQNIVKPLANFGLTALDRTNQIGTKFSDAYRDLVYNTDGNRNPVANIAKIGTSMVGAYSIPKVFLADILNAVAPTDFTKGVTSGYGDMVTMTEQTNNNGEGISGGLGRIGGNLLGWRKNIINKGIGDVFNRALPYKDVLNPKNGEVIQKAWKIGSDPVKSYLATRSTRGATEQLPYALSQLDSKATGLQNLGNFLKSEAGGALSEIVTDKAVDLGGKALDRVWNGSKPAQEQIKNLTKKSYHSIRDLTGKFAKQAGKKLDEITQKYPNVPAELVDKVKIMEKNIKSKRYVGVGLFKDEVDTVRQTYQQMLKDREALKLKNQGGYIDFGAKVGGDDVAPKAKNEVQELVDYARKRGYQDEQINTMLRNKGYDTTGANLRGQPSTIASILANRKKQFSETLKPIPDEVEPRKLTYRPEPSASDLAKSDRNAELMMRGDKAEIEAKQTDIDMESRQEFARPTAKPPASKRDLDEIFETRRLQETDEVLSAERMGRDADSQLKVDKFAGQNARVKYKNVNAKDLGNTELAQAVKEAKALDDWEVKNKATKSTKADQAWQKVAEIENGKTFRKEVKIDETTIAEDTKNTRAEFENLVNRYEKAKTQSTMAVDKSGLLDIGKDKTDDIISAIEKTDGKDGDYTPAELEMIKTTKDFWTKARAIGNSMGLDIKKTKDYFTHIYDQKLNSKGFGKKTLGQKTTFANERVFKTYQEALEKAGLTKAFDSIAEFGEVYMKKNLTTKAKKDFFAKVPWKQAWEIKGHEGEFTAVEYIPGMPKPEDGGSWYLPKEAAKEINSFFHPSEPNKALETAGKVGKLFQDIKLNAGIPGTPINYMGVSQTVKETAIEVGQILMGKKNPLKSHALTNFAKVLFSPGKTKQFFRDNSKSIIEIQGKFRLDTSYNASDMMGKTFGQKVKDNGALSAVDSIMGDKTFKQLIPMNIVSTYNDVKSTLIKGGKSEKEAIDIAREVVGRTYNLTTNLKAVSEDKNVRNAMQAIFMAPQYKKTMVDFWGNVAKAVVNPTAPENQALVSFAVGSGAFYVAMNAVNKLNTGNFMWENPGYDKDKMYVNIGENKVAVSFLPGLTYVPRMAIDTVLHPENAVKNLEGITSSPVGTAIDISRNKDYFGNDIYDTDDGFVEKYAKIGKYAIDETISPYVAGAKSLKDVALDKDGEIADKDINNILKGFEMPVKYISKKKYESALYYDTQKDIYNKLTPEEQKIYDKVKMKKDDFAGSTRDKVADALDMVNYPKVMQAKRDIAIATAKKTGKDVDPLYLLDDDKLTTYYQIQALANNSQAQMALKNKNEWYSDLSDDRSAYFKKLIASGEMKQQDGEYPQAKPETQKKLDYLKQLKTPTIKKKQDYYYTLPQGSAERRAYAKANPDLVSYWDTVRAYKEANPDIQEFKDLEAKYFDKVGLAFGIEPEEKASTASSGGGGGNSWSKYYDDKDFFTLLNKLGSGNKPSKSKLSDIKAILKVSENSSAGTKRIRDLLAKNSKNFDKKITSITGSKAKM